MDDSGISLLLSWQFLIFSISIFGIVFIIRTILQYFFTNIASKKWYRQLFLPILPLTLGAVIGYVAKAYPYPWAQPNFSGRVLFGFAAGLLSSFVYKMVTENIINKANQIQNSVNTAATQNGQTTGMNGSTPPNPQ